MARQPPNGVNKVVVGQSDNFWLWSANSGWDLTHPPTPDAPPVQPSLLLSCEISKLTIDPAKTALVIIDMQNYSMNTALGGRISPAVFRAMDMLLKYGIPAARKANLQIIWLNWCLTEENLANIPPGTLRVFGWRANTPAIDYGIFPHSPATADDANDCGAVVKDDNIVCTQTMVQCGEAFIGKPPGTDLGQVVLADGTSVAAGRALMKDTWNAELYGPLQAAFEESRSSSIGTSSVSRPDVQLRKDRNSGMYDASCECRQFLEKSGIRTILFAGMNTDQCVMSTLQDAFSLGYDTIMLRDACATNSPGYAQRSAELNCAFSCGFLSSCRALAAAVGIDP
jgi:nicotinamidase-related amidase